jgi:hypothetical protein
MSWTVAIVGRPHAIKKALEAQAGSLTGQSREEYERALPHLVALVTLNEPSNELSKDAVEIVASGHASIRTHGDGTKTVDYSSCNVSIKRLGAMIVE